MKRRLPDFVLYQLQMLFARKEAAPAPKRAEGRSS